ncbi:MAG: hypothetical protein ABI234_00015 [Ktedonobacteraceae bacterium]
MATLEERLTTIEHEQAELKQDNAELKQDNAEIKQTNAELKQKIELQTIAIGGLINKAILESINEKNDKIFQVLINHDEFTNQQLAELRERVEVQVEGKIVGMQVEMRQGFKDAQTQVVELDGKVVGLQTEMRQRFEQQNVAMNTRFEAQDQRFEALDQRFELQDRKIDQILHLLNTFISKPE